MLGNFYSENYKVILQAMHTIRTHLVQIQRWVDGKCDGKRQKKYLKKFTYESAPYFHLQQNGTVSYIGDEHVSDVRLIICR